MSTRLAIEARVRRYFEDEVQIAALTADTDLLATGVLDSMALVGLVLALEEELGISISLAECELSDFRSVARIAEVFSPREPAP